MDNNQEFKNVCTTQIRASIALFTKSLKLNSFDIVEVSETVERFTLDFVDGTGLRIVITLE